MRMKIISGDDVIVISGKDKGKVGKVIKVIKLIRKGCGVYKVIVSGVNLYKRHAKQTERGNGGVSINELPIDISNVALLDPKTRVRTRLGFKLLDNKKVRFAKCSGEVIG